MCHGCAQPMCVWEGNKVEIFMGGVPLIVLIVLVAALLIWLWLRFGVKWDKPELPHGAWPERIMLDEIKTLDDAGLLITSAITTATHLVGAAEQLWLTGKIPKDERFAWVERELRRVLPSIEPGQIIALIEGAVYWMKVDTLRNGAVDKEAG